MELITTMSYNEFWYESTVLFVCLYWDIMLVLCEQINSVSCGETARDLCYWLYNHPLRITPMALVLL